jgi:hypothetical protein
MVLRDCSMHLTIRAQYARPDHPETSLHVAGEVLTINGVATDCSGVPEGGEGWPPEDSLIQGPIRRVDGVLYATVLFQFDSSADLSDVASWTIPDAAGAVVPPAARKPAEEAAE